MNKFLNTASRFALASMICRSPDMESGASEEETESDGYTTSGVLQSAYDAAQLIAADADTLALLETQVSEKQKDKINAVILADDLEVVLSVSQDDDTIQDADDALGSLRGRLYISANLPYPGTKTGEPHPKTGIKHMSNHADLYKRMTPGQDKKSVNSSFYADMTNSLPASRADLENLADVNDRIERKEGGKADLKAEKSIYTGRLRSRLNLVKRAIRLIFQRADMHTYMTGLVGMRMLMSETGDGYRAASEPVILWDEKVGGKAQEMSVTSFLSLDCVQAKADNLKGKNAFDALMATKEREEEDDDDAKEVSVSSADDFLSAAALMVQFMDHKAINPVSVENKLKKGDAKEREHLILTVGDLHAYISPLFDVIEKDYLALNAAKKKNAA